MILAYLTARIRPCSVRKKINRYHAGPDLISAVVKSLAFLFGAVKETNLK